jgi:hypothetical protein
LFYIRLTLSGVRSLPSAPVQVLSALSCLASSDEDGRVAGVWSGVALRMMPVARSRGDFQDLLRKARAEKSKRCRTEKERRCAHTYSVGTQGEVKPCGLRFRSRRPGARTLCASTDPLALRREAAKSTRRDPGRRLGEDEDPVASTGDHLRAGTGKTAAPSSDVSLV